jgi:hypothetical protein
MPGYRSLSPKMTGTAADSAREAESHRQGGDLVNAAILLEEALAASQALSPRLPGWLCGRLAALYRTLGRYDDEVDLLERYRESQISDDARTRYDARLSKARTIAERKRRSDSGALSSVRKAMHAPRRSRRRAADRAADVSPNLSAHTLMMLTELLGTASDADFDGELDHVLTLCCADARTHGAPVEHLVSGLRAATQRATGGTVSEAVRAERYTVALVRLLAIYFEEPGT